MATIVEQNSNPNLINKDNFLYGTPDLLSEERRQEICDWVNSLDADKQKMFLQITDWVGFNAVESWRYANDPEYSE